MLSIPNVKGFTFWRDNLCGARLLLKTTKSTPNRGEPRSELYSRAGFQPPEYGTRELNIVKK